MNKTTYNHDEVSKNIQGILVLIISYGLFCALVLGISDGNLIESKSLTIPFAGVNIPIDGFFIVAPIILLFLTFHLHVFVGQLNSEKCIKSGEILPFVFNIDTVYAKIITHLVFYWLSPIILVAFIWKASPLPERLYPVVAFSIVVFSLIIIFLNRNTQILKSTIVKYSIYSIAFVAVIGSCFYGLSEKSKLRSWDLQNANLSGLVLRDFDFNGANLVKSNLTKADLEGVNLNGADLSKSILVGADFERANLNNSRFFRVDAKDANFSAANLGNADFLQSDLRNTKFIGSFMHHANLQQTELEGANFQIANLNSVDFVAASLNGMDIRGADIRGARFGLFSSDIEGASLKSLDGAVVDDRTVYCENTIFNDFNPNNTVMTKIPCNVKNVVEYMNNKK